MRRARGPRLGRARSGGSLSFHFTQPPRARCRTSHCPPRSMHRYFPRRVTPVTWRPTTDDRGGSKVLRAEMAASSQRSTRRPEVRSDRNRVSASTSGNSGTPRSSHARGALRNGERPCHSEEVGPLGGGRRRRRQRVGALAVCSGLVLGACAPGAGTDTPVRGARHSTTTGAPPSASSSTSAPTTTTVPEPPVTPVQWTACGALLCGSVAVPIDYDHPQSGTINIAVTMHRATDPAARIGSLVIDPGGPGVSGVSDLPAELGVLTPALTARFDIVEFDPRGVGRSSPVRCSTAQRVLPEHVDSGAVARPGPEHARRPAGAHRRRRGLRIGVQAVQRHPAALRGDGRRGTRPRPHPPGPRRPDRSPTSGTPTARCSAPSTPRCSPRTCAPWCSTGPSTRP